MFHRTRYLGSALALAAAAAALPALAARPLIDAVAAGVPVIAGVRDLGPIAASSAISVAMTLAYRHADQLERLIDHQSDPSSPLYRHFLSNAQFNGYFAPSRADYARVAAALRRAGFTVSHVYTNRTLLDATAPAGIAERYFKTVIHTVAQPGHGLRYANAAPALLPAELVGTVDSVVGLDNLEKARFTYQFGPRRARFGPDNVGGPLHGPDGGFGPLALATGFDFPVQHGFGGKGEAVANVAGDVADSDLAAFEAYFGIARTGALLRTQIQGPSQGANIEATLDVETMASLDPNADVHLYILQNPVDQPGEDAYNQIVTDNSVVAVNSSFGVCENSDPSYGVAAKKIVAQGEVKGISWAASTGDGGAAQCGGPQLLPAALARVTGLGGTSLSVDQNGNYVSESAWNGGGGGISSTFKLPRFQQGVAGLGSTTNRNLPDVAFPADPATGYSFYYQGAWQGPIGGTSWSSPTFVALQAEVDQMEKSRQGYANPKIYRIFKASQYKAFHDITTGNNGFPAKAGYDNATGIGSIVGFAFGRRE
ncbi:MAG: S53 family serine peptidase [Candidatus Baltobacteraceae bacterium]